MTTQWTTPSGRAFAVACAFVGLTATANTANAQSNATSSTSPGRWQQSSLLLTPNDAPTFLIISGKTVTTGQTVASSPATASTLSLDLSRPISNLSNTPWLVVDDMGPTASSASAVAMSSTSALYFGGDASADLTVTSPLMNDSAWLLACSDSSPPLQSWIHATRNWAAQPLRRESAYSASASNGTVSRAWFFGGMRTDKSGVTFNEMWEAQVGLDVDNNDAFVPSTGKWQQWQAATNDVVPPDMWDGQAVVVPSSKSGQMPSVWIIGGTQLYNGQQERLVSMSNIWVYTPSLELGQGSWDVVPISGSSPDGRRGHVAVEIGGGQIWIQGGRSLDGTDVYGDSAVLDTVKRRWSSSSSNGPVVWGHSATVLGETVLMAFGYGSRAPATNALVVYAPGNDTYLDAYYPSYETIVPNPKTTDAVSASTSPTVVIDPTVYPSVAVTDPTSGASASSSPVSPQPATTYKQKPTGSTNAWVAPGGPTQTGRAGASSTLTDKDNSSTTSTPTQVVAGAVVGSLLGALAVIAVGVLVVRRRKSQHRYSAYEGSWAKWKSAFPGRDRDEDDDGKGSLVAGPMYDVSKRSSFYDTSSGADMSEKPLPVPSSSGPIKSVKALVAGLLSSVHRRTLSRQHFLRSARDEETVWDDLSATDMNGAKPALRWTTFADSSDNLETVSLDETDTIRGRGGRGVWEGYEFGSASGSAEGSVVTDTVKSSTSFLGSALGGFAAVATIPAAEEDDDAARALSRIDEEGSEDGDRYGSSSVVGRNDSTTALTREISSSTYSTSVGTQAAPVRPFSPVKSLYGSTFNASPALMPFMMNRKTSRSSSAGSNDFNGPRNSSWWGRLSRKSTVEVSTATANEAIRDPTPAPSLDVIAGLSRSATDASDPFSDAGAPRERADVTRPDEQGRFDAEVLRSASRRAQDASVSSRASSDVTATSSVLEERMRTMDVVQRVRTGSGSTTSVDLTPTLGRDDHGFGRLPDTDEEDVEMEPIKGGTVELGATRQHGRVEIVLTPNDELKDPFSDRISLTRSISRKRPAPAASDAPSSPSTPSRRLLGPRALPPPSPVMPAAKRRAPPMTAGAAGVRAMVQQIERRASGSSPVRSSTPPRSMSASKSMSSFALGVQEPRSPTRAMTTSRSMTDVAAVDAGEDRRPKVAHKLARKPVLYVANPDVL
ncbi:hypothetical protein ACM66B_004132 [Microbotryomycetes sp. NB124-2]